VAFGLLLAAPAGAQPPPDAPPVAAPASPESKTVPADDADAAAPDGADAAAPDGADAAAPDGADAAEEAASEPAAPDQPPIGADEKRAIPDYDGRGDDPVTAGDVFIWVPRGVFFPVYLVSEYVIRWPLGKATVALEENDVIGKLTDFFTFGPGGNSGIVPSALIDFGLRPSIGLYFFSDDTFWKGSGVRSHLAFGGIDWYRATLSLRHTFAEKSRPAPVGDGVTASPSEEAVPQDEQFVQLKGIYSHRPDWLFWGIGPDTVPDAESDYTAQYISAVLSYEAGLWRSSYLKTYASVIDAQYGDTEDTDELSIPQAIDQGFYAERPPLFDDGSLIAKVGFEGSIDSRLERSKFTGLASDHVSPSGSGGKLGLRGALGGGLRESLVDPSDPNSAQLPSFVQYGATLGAFLDLYEQRVIGVSAVADFVDPTSEGAPIPFSELVSLGGSRPMRGYLKDRLLGRSAVTTRVEYRWPIWVFLDGTAQYELGNVFGERLAGFDVKKLRHSAGMGFRSNASRDHSFELLVAFGTDTIENGSTPDSFRFVFGSTAGF